MRGVRTSICRRAFEAVAVTCTISRQTKLSVGIILGTYFAVLFIFLLVFRVILPDGVWGGSYETGDCAALCENSHLCHLPMEERPVIQQPANAWTSLTFFLVGLWPLVGIRMDLSSIAFFVVQTYVAVTSFVFHASITVIWQRLGAAASWTSLLTLVLHGMHCASGGKLSWKFLAPINFMFAILVLTLRKRIDEAIGAANVWIIFLTAIITITMCLLWVHTRRFLQGNTTGNVTDEDDQSIPSTQVRSSKYRSILWLWFQAIAPAILLVIAASFNQLSRNPEKCVPDSPFQAFAAWSFLVAVASLLLWLFFDNHHIGRKQKGERGQDDEAYNHGSSLCLEAKSIVVLIVLAEQARHGCKWLKSIIVLQIKSLQESYYWLIAVMPPCCFISKQTKLSIAITLTIFGVILFIFLLVFLVILPDGVWGGGNYESGYCPGLCENRDQCDQTMEERAIIHQPINAWTNMSFILLGLWPLVAIRQDLSTVSFFLAEVYVAVTSFVFHASITVVWQMLDAAASRSSLITLVLHGIHCASGGCISWKCLAPINLLIAFLLTAFKREVDEKVGSVEFWIISVSMIIIVSSILLIVNTRSILREGGAVGVREEDDSETHEWGPEHRNTHASSSKSKAILWMVIQGLIPGVLFALAVTMNRLSKSGVLCLPDSAFQPHAAWHVFNAMASLTLWLFFDNHNASGENEKCATESQEQNPEHIDYADEQSCSEWVNS